VGQKKKLKVKGTSKKIKWSSSNKKVVAVSKKGVVKAKKKGKAVITAKAGKWKGKVKVVVKSKKTTPRPQNSTPAETKKPDDSDSTSKPTVTARPDTSTVPPDVPTAEPDSTEKPDSPTAEPDSTVRPRDGNSDADSSKDEKIPKELQEIPSNYFTEADKKGSLVELNYETYESKTYEQKSKKLNKRAIVYLPYGYSENEKYNVFYLMHGGWSNETVWLGTPENPSAFKNVVDHAVSDGKMKPFIIVCPTYNNESPSDSGDYTLAYYTLTVNYHNELMNDLIPAVEGKYSTYAENVTPDGIKASRDHRAFGGFSMGSVATWHTFLNCLDAFRYFMPSSGAIDSTGNRLDQAVTESGYTWKDFFIYAATGTSDFACSQFTNQIQGMLGQESGNFREADNEAEGNLAFRIKEGYSHDGRASTEYAYNGMCWFWNHGESSQTTPKITEQTLVKDVMSNPVFGSYGRLLFPVHRTINDTLTLENVGSILTWYNNVRPEKTVEIVNTLMERAADGETIFYDIYTDAEKQADPDKADTGLFFFKGNPGEKYAVVNAGGGFAYVGAMHDSFPVALELSKKGYNAFALIYRPGQQTACEDLARAVSFIHQHKEELEVDTSAYSLWGGSAGARMAALVGEGGPAAYGGDSLPRPAAVVTQYTGYSSVSPNNPPTYANVGTSDGIANYQTMQNRIDQLKAQGTDAEIEVFSGLPHGFGLGTGTVAEGWIDSAVSFWERQIQ
jgi:Enterochelin esterase and related enzymes